MLFMNTPAGIPAISAEPVAASGCTTNGLAFYSFADPVGSNTATQTTTGDQGTLATSALNGLSAVTLNGSSDFYTPATTVASSNVTYTFFAVFSLAATGSTQAFTGTGGQAPLAQISSANHFAMSLFGVGALGTGCDNPDDQHLLCVPRNLE